MASAMSRPLRSSESPNRNCWREVVEIPEGEHLRQAIGPEVRGVGVVALDERSDGGHRHRALEVHVQLHLGQPENPVPQPLVQSVHPGTLNRSASCDHVAMVLRVLEAEVDTEAPRVETVPGTVSTSGEWLVDGPLVR